MAPASLRAMAGALHGAKGRQGGSVHLRVVRGIPDSRLPVLALQG